jgi:hypothetical protein
VTHDTIWDNWAVGLYIEAITGATVEDNLIYATADSAYFRSGTPEFCTLIGCETSQFANPKDLIFANNIVSGCSNLVNLVQYESATAYTNYAFYDNTLMNPYQGGNALTSNMTQLSEFTFQNNLVYAPGNSVVAGFNAPSSKTVGNNLWSAAPPSVLAGSGDVVTATPGLANAGYVPAPGGNFDASVIVLGASSAAIGKGIANATVTDDYFGHVRPTSGACDIGAYQH